MGLNIDFKMLPMKAHYFLYNAGTGSVVPFMPVYARQLGFSTFVVGTVYSILPILGLIAKPLFGAIADKYQRHKSMFLAFLLLTIVSFASIKFIAPIPKTSQLQFHCNDGVSDLRYCPETLDYCGADRLRNGSSAGTPIQFDLKCEMKEDWMWKLVCDEWHTNSSACSRDDDNMMTLTSYVRKNHVELIKNCLLFEIQNSLYRDKLSSYNNESAMHVTCPKKALNGRYFKLNCTAQANHTDVMDVIAENGIHDDRILSFSQFWWFFSALAISWIGMAVVVSVGDAICFDLLGKRHELFGRQRLWGAIGWGVFSIIAGILVDEISGSNYAKNYTVIYFLMGAALLPDMLVSSCLEFKPNGMSSSIIKDVAKLFKSLRIAVFFVWCIAIGFCMALVWNFLFWHLEDLADQKSDCGHQERMKTLQGIALGVQSFVGELPFFFIAGWLINKIGHINSMTMVLFAFGVRLCLYSALSNPWWVLPIEMMQGLTFALFYTTMATYANIVAPHGTAATLQGLVGAIFEGVGVSAGSFLGGYLMNAIGGSATFRIFGIGAMILSVVHYIVQYFLEKYSTEPDLGYMATADYSSPTDEMQIFEEDDYYD